uniref:Uncharacterized protein n=1 Tax=Anguilla anguilla TaxID=7936 RepID=A0A0E9WGW6_ANGAN
MIFFINTPSTSNRGKHLSEAVHQLILSKYVSTVCTGIHYTNLTILQEAQH